MMNLKFKTCFLLISINQLVYADPNPNQLPTGGQVTQGIASINQLGNTLTIQQSTDKIVTEWGGFNIGEAAAVNFLQPNSNSIALNRIADQNPSMIYGQLNANGNVYLINPNGIIFGKNAQIDTNGIIASSLQMSNQDFFNNTNIFSQGLNSAAGKIDNQGKITGHGGVVALIAPQISNSGRVVNDGGSIALAAGEKVGLDFSGDGLMTVKVDTAAVNALIENKGLIQADAGTVIMTSQSANAVMDSVINNTGRIQAKTMQNRNGRIVLDAGGTGVTTTSGYIDASSGGDINANNLTQTDGSIIGNNMQFSSFSQTAGVVAAEGNLAVAKNYSQTELGSISVGDNVTINNYSGDLMLGNLAVGGTLTVNGFGGDIVQVENTQLTIDGVSRFDAKNSGNPSDVYLDSEGNNFLSAINITGNNLLLVADNSLLLGDISANGFLDVIAGNNIRQNDSGTISAVGSVIMGSFDGLITLNPGKYHFQSDSVLLDSESIVENIVTSSVNNTEEGVKEADSEFEQGDSVESTSAFLNRVSQSPVHYR